MDKETMARLIRQYQRECRQKYKDGKSEKQMLFIELDGDNAMVYRLLEAMYEGKTKQFITNIITVGMAKHVEAAMIMLASDGRNEELRSILMMRQAVDEFFSAILSGKEGK